MKSWVSQGTRKRGNGDPHSTSDPQLAQSCACKGQLPVSPERKTEPREAAANHAKELAVGPTQQDSYCRAAPLTQEQEIRIDLVTGAQ